MTQLDLLKKIMSTHFSEDRINNASQSKITDLLREFKEKMKKNNNIGSPEMLLFCKLFRSCLVGGTASANHIDEMIKLLSERYNSLPQSLTDKTVLKKKFGEMISNIFYHNYEIINELMAMNFKVCFENFNIAGFFTRLERVNKEKYFLSAYLLYFEIGGMSLEDKDILLTEIPKHYIRNKKMKISKSNLMPLEIKIRYPAPVNLSHPSSLPASVQSRVIAASHQKAFAGPPSPLFTAMTSSSTFSSISAAQKRPASPTTAEPGAKRVATAPKKREYERQALRQCYEEPELWYAPKRLSFQETCQLLWNDATLFEEGKLEAALSSIINDPPVILCYQTIIHLFYMQIQLIDKNERALAEKAAKAIDTLLPTLEPFEQGQLVRYSSLIHTNDRSLANDFRSKIAKALMMVVANEGDIVLISTQEKIEKTWYFCDRLYGNPNQIKEISQLQMLAVNGAEEVKTLALQLRNRCESWLTLLCKGKEVRLPAFYHGIGTKHKTSKVVPHSFLNGKIIAQNEGGTGKLLGAFVSTRLEDEDDPAYFGSGFSFPLDASFRHFYDIYNFCKPNTVSQQYAATRRLNDRWLGVQNGFPILLQSEDGALMGHNLATVIADDEDSVEQQRRELPKALSTVPVMSRREAKLLEYGLRRSAPVLVPRYKEQMVNVEALNSHHSISFNSSVKQKLRTNFLCSFKFYFVCEDEGVQRADAHIKSSFEEKIAKDPLLKDGDPILLSNFLGKFSLGSKGLIPLSSFLGKFSSDSKVLQQLTCDGYLTMGSPTPVLNMGDNVNIENLMKVLFENRQKHLEEVRKLFPFMADYSVEPLHHVWPWGKEEDFGKAVGYNPYLFLNFASIRDTIFKYAVEARDEMLALDSFANFLEEMLLNGDTARRQNFMTFIIYKMIERARTCEVFSEGVGIFVPVPKTEEKLLEIFFDPDSLDNTEGHGRGLSENPNNPWLTAKLYQDLDPIEKEALRCIILLKKYPEINEKQKQRVFIVKGLMEEMGSGMYTRYFSSEKARQALPKGVSTEILIKLLQGESETEIQAKHGEIKVKALSRDAIDKLQKECVQFAYGGVYGIRKAMRTKHSIDLLLKSVTNNDKGLWKNVSLLKKAAEALSLDNIDKLMPSPFNVLLLGYKLTKQKPKDSKDLISPIERKIIESQCRSMLQLLSKVEEGRLRRALPLIDGNLGRELRYELYPMLYKDSGEYICYDQSVGELLTEGKALADRALEDTAGNYMKQCGLSHLTPERQKEVMQEWREFVVERQQKIANGEAVSLTQWTASTLAELGRIVLYPFSEAHLAVGIHEIGLPNILEAERSIVENKEQKSFSTKYLCGTKEQKLPASCLTFFANDDAKAAEKGFNKWFVGDITKVRRLSREAALLERRFLIGRRPDMISSSWKRVETSSCEKLHIPRLTG